MIQKAQHREHTKDSYTQVTKLVIANGTAAMQAATAVKCATANDKERPTNTPPMPELEPYIDAICKKYVDVSS